MPGYKQPPRHTQFRKGQSGNPKGRPKKSRETPSGRSTANALALKEAERPIKIREGEKISEIITIEAVIRAEAKSAVSGNAYAQRHFIDRFDRAERDRRQRLEQYCKEVEEYVAEKRKEIRDAIVEGLPAPNPLPHPDDIEIDYEKGVFCRGPRNEKDQQDLENILEYRDVLIMQHAYDERCYKGEENDPLDRPGQAFTFAIFRNRLVPKRYRLSDHDIAERISRYDRMAIRELAKELYRARKRIGMPMPRGATMSSFRRASQLFAVLRRAIDEGTAEAG